MRFLFKRKSTFNLPLDGRGVKHRKRCRTDEVIYIIAFFRMLCIRHLITRVPRELLLEEKPFGKLSNCKLNSRKFLDLMCFFDGKLTLRKSFKL